MPKIIPIRDLKNTSEISNMCHESSEPIYITKNGYGDMVIMSMEAYEEKLCRQAIYACLSEAEEDIAMGRVAEAGNAIYKLREKYDI
ncbi:MAG: type II toxin-antitoxin system Phd/YefM family antitoxin [Selenomonadaceae bacterium]|nr:type II toxin-antitoxin system Phd/YefM family antitoxin [Selenomonadaceae bacterium]